MPESFPEIRLKQSQLVLFGEGALEYRTLLHQQLAPLRGSLTPSGAKKAVSLGLSVRRFNC